MFHDAGKRCVCIFKTDRDGGVTETEVAQESIIIDRYPFPDVLLAMKAYQPADSLCVIHQRGNFVSVFITGNPSFRVDG